jgi:hypothetical protein
MKFLVKLLSFEITILLLDLLCVSHCERVILRTHLKSDLHLTFIVEKDKRVHCGSIASVHVLVSYLKVTDVLKTLNCDFRTISLVLVELYRLHDTLNKEISQSYDACRED